MSRQLRWSLPTSREVVLGVTRFSDTGTWPLEFKRIEMAGEQGNRTLLSKVAQGHSGFEDRGEAPARHPLPLVCDHGGDGPLFDTLRDAASLRASETRQRGLRPPGAPFSCATS